MKIHSRVPIFYKKTPPLSLSMPDLIAISRESGCLFGENQVLLM
jgi:hypothetical protein